MKYRVDWQCRAEWFDDGGPHPGRFFFDTREEAEAFAAREDRAQPDYAHTVVEIVAREQEVTG